MISKLSVKGFTFIETLVVIALFGLTLPLVLTILFTIMRQQIRIFSLSEVKRQGDNIVNFLDSAVRENAYRIYDSSGAEVCHEDNSEPFPHQGTPASFRDRYNSSFSLDYTYPDLLFSYPDPNFPAPTHSFPQGPLNSTKMIVESFFISCIRSSQYSAPLVTVNFTICFNHDGSCTSSNPEEIVSLDYQTNIKLRSFPTP
ncbi:hypothetical protein A2774_01315 [Candidatus Roizmanbacteria bacterium RIFCSPHIGHO2_01_FULL_39_12c]|uniref:Type II secretion system protein n=1 Tax=Candidatus Roizmanbacteria bacterium RIFCSPHIGHO2_01_FULL_39_12c TaxID=1802031 RepID=A0A1F7GDU0_9BACT|nr:MAG: hypothetical protein A2774_01315 [Candidatus Roizmanbacteria bacterium RIFCSPHIGHO2_01_FULL_39_12c]OGK47513.1 MAG: hypothetical protein A2963_01320 [Candidatus Roizmanbacteria bacterium RIFCSPLOWO2_01_FULL_40_13]